MAIIWSSYAGHYRVGIDVAVSGDLATLAVYGENQSGYSHAWHSTIHFTGDWSGSKQVHVSTGLGTSFHELHRTQIRFTGTRSFAVTMSIPYWGGTVYVARSVTISPPAQHPKQPTGLRVQRSSDTVHVLNWTNTEHYDAVQVFRSSGDGNYYQIAAPTGNPTTYTDTSTKANERYYYKIQAVRQGLGSGLTAAAGPVFTTPAAPTEVAAARVGSTIQITAKGQNTWANRYDVQDVSGTVIATNVALPYTHTNPAATTTHKYRVRARLSGTTGTLTSAWSNQSNAVTLVSPPAAPSVGSTPPAKTVAGAVRFTWSHNSTDTSKQERFQLSILDIYGSDDEQIYTGTGSVSEYVRNLSADEYYWKVRTKGAHSDYSPWSRTQVFQAITRPVVQILEPSGTHWIDPKLTVNWRYTQPENERQSEYELQLETSDGNVVETLTGNGDLTRAVFNTLLLNNTAYRVRARAASSGIWSDWSPYWNLNVRFIPPAIPSAAVAWDDRLGLAEIVATRNSGAVSTVKMSVERLDDHGYTLIAENLTQQSNNLTDPEAYSSGATTYRITAYAATGATSVKEVTLQAGSSSIWIGGGSSYSEIAKLHFDPELSIETGRLRTSHRFSGRPKPVAYASAQLTNTIKISGHILEDDTLNSALSHVERVCTDPSPIHLYRDPTGRRIYGNLSALSLTRIADQLWSYSLSIEETDH